MGASIASSVINLTKTIVGAGLLAIPYAFRFDGVLLGFSLILIGGISTIYGLYIIKAVSHKIEGETSFFALCSITYPKLTLLFDFSIAIQCFGVAISYLILFGDLVPTLINNYFSRNQVILLSLFIIIPLISLRKLDSLKFGSVVALSAIAYLLVLVLTHALFDDYSQVERGNIRLWPRLEDYGGILSTFSIIIFAFTAAQNICTVINEIEDKSNLNLVIVSSVGIAGLLFSFVGFAGYLQFGDKVGGNLILEYESSLVSTKIGKFALVLMVALSYPLMFHPCRISINNMIYWVELEFTSRSKEEDTEESPLLGSTESHQDIVHVEVPFSQRRFIILSIFLIISSYGLAITITSFELILALVGATGSTLICFILPGLFGYKLFEDKLNQTLSLSLTIWGIVIMIGSVYATLYL